MKFERRIFLTYSLLIVLIVIGIGVAFRVYLVQQERNRVRDHMQLMVEKNARQIDEVVRSMKLLSDYLLSDPSVLSSFSTLATLDDSTRRSLIFREQARSTVRRSFLTYGIIENFYQVIYFNRQGDVITTKFLAPQKDMKTFDLENIPWLGAAEDSFGRPVVSGSHVDSWASRDTGTPVFSLGRAMPGFGYLEVQQPTGMIENIILSEYPEQVLIFNSKGDVLFSRLSEEQNQFYQQLKISQADQFSDRGAILPTGDNPFGTEFVAVYRSPFSGIVVLLIRDRNSFTSAVIPVTVFIVLAALSIVLFSLLYIHVVAKRLTDPIRSLTRQVEKTALENINQDILIDRTNDEIEALSSAFVKLLGRLNRAIVHEKHMSLVTLKSQIDALNAQINPHFIYNILNVISYQGLQSNNEDICNICDSLANILRYSTDPRRFDATVREEIDHLTEYLFLMKNRYFDKVSWTINIPAEMNSLIIPRLLLQPLVENGLNHGFDTMNESIHIQIEGQLDQERWRITIQDNGSGFLEDQLQNYRKKMDNIREVLEAQEQTIELKLGGMGLINSFARMFLTYKDACIFAVENVSTGGARITLGGSLEYNPSHYFGEHEVVLHA